MKSLNTVIREMYTKVEESVDLDESTKAYAASLEKMANDKKLKNISKKDRDTLAKLADLMKNANEEVELDEDALNEAIEAIVEEGELLEDYFKVQYFGKDGKPEAGKESNFKDEKSAKRYLARAQKAVKVGEYKLTKEKGKLESVEKLDENVGKKVYEKKAGQSVVKVFKYPDGKMFAFFDSKGYGETNMSIKKLDKGVLNKAVKHFDDNKGLLGSSMDAIYESVNYFGHAKNHGISDSLLAAVNRVVTGESEAVEPSAEEQNEIIEQGAEDICEALVTGVQGKDGKKYAIELQKSGRKVVIRTKNQFGDIDTIDLKKAAKLFEQEDLDKLEEALKNPYKGKSERDLKRKLDSFETQLADLIKKSRGRQRREIEAEIRDMETKVQQVRAALKEDNTNDVSDDGEGLDKVQPKAVKKKFKDRKDKDIDNDGDVDDSDKFLHKKRKAISKAIDKEKSEGKKDKVEINPKLQEEMTPEQEKKREEIVLKLKEKEDEFKKKYGDRAKEVMYATATKLAMKNTK